MSGFSNEEEDLAEAVRPIGDLVAVGQPGEPLPLPGAARMYWTNDEWQDAVLKRMREAPLVIIRGKRCAANSKEPPGPDAHIFAMPHTCITA